MSSENWSEVTLGEVADLQTGFPFKSKDYASDKGTRLIRGDNVVQGALRWKNVKLWPKVDMKIHGDYFLKKDDIVLAMDRPWIAAGLKYSSIREKDTPSLLVQRVARLRGNKFARTKYLSYIIGSRLFTNHVLAIQTGTAVPHISATQIKSFKFKLPGLNTQISIAKVLGDLDDKIEVLREMNRTLENIAQAMFKAWFVDIKPIHAKVAGATSFKGMPQALFDTLPKSIEESELGDIPTGWTIKPLDEVAEFLNGLALQKHRPKEGEDFLPVIKITELRKGITPKSEQASPSIPEKYKIVDGDFLFSWSGSLLAKFWTDGDGALNQHLFKVTSEAYPIWFVASWVWHHLEQFQRIAAAKATTMGHIKRSHLSDAKVIVPNPKQLEMMTHSIQPFFQKQISNSLEINSLVSLRDTLLPKLISGELEAPSLVTLGLESVS